MKLTVQNYLVCFMFLVAVFGCTGGDPVQFQRPTQQLNSETIIDVTAGITSEVFIPIIKPDPSTEVSVTINGSLSSPAPSENGQNGTPDADVLFVHALQGSDDSWTFDVTVQHPDSGWEDYADGWDVLTRDGIVLKPDPSSKFTRLLLHPHIDEQPFTRSQSGIIIPPDVSVVIVRAHDLLDGFGGKEVIVDLTRTGGVNYTVERK